MGVDREVLAEPEEVVQPVAEGDVEEGEQEVPEEPVDEEEGEELRHQLRLELALGAVVLPRVERRGEPQEDRPIERLHEDAPRSGDEDDQRGLGGARVR